MVESAGFNDKTGLDLLGHPHSDALRVTERYHRRDFGHMDVEMTMDDSRFYTKPFTLKFTEILLPDRRSGIRLQREQKDVVHSQQK